MTVRIIREPSVAGTTFGVVFVDGRFFSFSLEDEIRERPGVPVSQWKVPGHSAIPAGLYELTITPSARFKRDLPLLLNVTGFDGIRFHPGNTHADTAGCVLLGAQREGVALVRSRQACDDFQDYLAASLQAGKRAWCLIENPMAA